MIAKHRTIDNCFQDTSKFIKKGDRGQEPLSQNLLTEDEILLQYYDIASSKV